MPAYVMSSPLYDVTKSPLCFEKAHSNPYADKSDEFPLRGPIYQSRCHFPNLEALTLSIMAQIRQKCAGAVSVSGIPKLSWTRKPKETMPSPIMSQTIYVKTKSR